MLIYNCNICPTVLRDTRCSNRRSSRGSEKGCRAPRLTSAGTSCHLYSTREPSHPWCLSRLLPSVSIFWVYVTVCRRRLSALCASFASSCHPVPVISLYPVGGTLSPSKHRPRHPQLASLFTTCYPSPALCLRYVVYLVHNRVMPSFLSSPVMLILHVHAK